MTHSTRAYRPAAWSAGGARSASSPAPKPIRAPPTCPYTSARPRTVSSSRSGTAPGRWRRARTLTWITRATTTRAEESRIRLTRMGCELLLLLLVLAVHGGPGGRRHGHRHRRPRSGLGLGREHRVARVLLRGLD